MLFLLPDGVTRAIQALNYNGYEAYAVGGCVRDCLMRKTPQDWDITTSATPEQVQSVFAEYRTVETGIDHGTLTVLIDGLSLEITTYRVDGKYSDSRHPDVVSFTDSLIMDLQRRDFTVNAMAYHPKEGVVDPFGGRKDLVDGILRCVGDPTLRFSEDALRILRGLRFSSTLSFTLEPHTAEALSTLSLSLRQVSPERIASEFIKLLCGADAAAILHQYRETIAVFLPEIGRCEDFSLISRVNTFAHTRLVALFYTADVSAVSAEAALRRLRLDRKTIDRVTRLLSTPSLPAAPQPSDLLRLLHYLEADLVLDYFSLTEADADIVQQTQKLLDDNVCYSIPMLAVSGNDLLKAGVPSGPAVGEALRELLSAVMDGTCPNTAESLLEHLRHSEKPVR